MKNYLIEKFDAKKFKYKITTPYKIIARFETHSGAIRYALLHLCSLLQENKNEN